MHYLQELKSYLLHHKRLVVIALLVLLALLWLFFPNGTGVNDGADREKTWQINTIKVQYGNYQSNVIVFGNVESPHTSMLKAAISADIIKTHILEGQLVKKGQLLISFDDREIRLVLDEKTADKERIVAEIKTQLNQNKSDKEAFKDETKLLAIQKKSVERQAYLLKRKLGAQEQYDSTNRAYTLQRLLYLNRILAINNNKNVLARLNAQLKKSVALEKRAQIDLTRTQIRAPFAGKVTSLNVSPGERVQIGAELITLFDTASVEIRAQIPLNNVPTLQALLRQGKIIRASGFVANTKIPLRLERLAGEIKRGQGGIAGLFSIVGKNELVSLGQLIKIAIYFPSVPNSLQLPATAIFDKTFVYIIKDSRLVSEKVDIQGEYTDKFNRLYYIVKTKLKAGTLICNTRLPNIRTGLKVNTTP